jgi:hypothetical protein
MIQVNLNSLDEFDILEELKPKKYKEKKRIKQPV